MTIRPIHPFPARMAPEILNSILSSLGEKSVILDPMTGSGTVIRNALHYNHSPIGIDKDPLAVLLSKVWTSSIDEKELKEIGSEVFLKASEDITNADSFIQDAGTLTFVKFWFAEEQRNDLAKLSNAINKYGGPVADALRVAMSRLIITNDKGASLAKDVSHSRPHKKGCTNEFNVLNNFTKSVNFLCKRIKENKIITPARVEEGDSRALSSIENSSIDAVITSPPYLNAVDYMRGHKMTLVWLGHDVKSLTTIRSNSIGAERQPDAYERTQIFQGLTSEIGDIHKLDNKLQKMIHRYAFDMYAMIGESKRVLKDGAQATFVIGNSCLRGNFVKNTEILKNAALLHGLKLIGETERDLPPNKRYLPPPSAETAGIQNRMRTESIITFKK